MRHTLLFLFLLVSNTITAQYTLIPDINFEKALITLSIDNGIPDGKVLTSSISNIATLSIGAKNISDLTGIEDFINLTELQCQANKLTTLDLSNNLKLKQLDFETNQLNALDLSNNLQLEYLDCHNNQLTTLDLSNNLQLVILECDSNQLTTLDLSNNLKLEDIDCRSNQLTNLNITKNLKLKIVESQNNKLTFLDLPSNINLTFLDLDNNYITNIDVSKNIGLQGLQVNFNLLKNLDVSKNINLMNLQCVENELKVLDLSKNPDLYLLYCRNNQLTSLDISKNPKINYVSCYNNNLTSLNLKNGKNTIFNTSFFYYCNFKFNPDLKCILVDNSAYSNANWSDLKDSTASYSDNLDVAPTISSPQFFCTQQNKTLNDIIITDGISVKWYDALINGNLLDQNTVLTNGSNYYASQTINGCESNRINIKTIVEDNQPPIPNLTTLPTITGDCHTQITTIPTATDTCAGLITATTTSPLSYSLPGTYTIVWNYDDGNGNSVTQNQTITINGQTLPIIITPQTFCIQQNADLNSITITGQNIKWYDALTNGNLLANTTPLLDGIIYYASQTINGCESDKVPVFINIQNTLAPTANTNQSFCTSQNPTLSSISITGTNLKWYDNSTLGNLLTDSTPLQDGQTYYASQTISNCESKVRTAISVSLISSLPANKYAELFCDDLNDGIETVNLNSYNLNLIPNDTNYIFFYYTSLSGAENETTNSKINNITNYKLALGENKIYVRINSNTTCHAVAELKLTLLSKPKITIEDIVPICENKTITIDAGAGFDDYLWSNGETSRTITVSNPGGFSVTVTDNHSSISCSSTKNFTVKESNKATINSIDTKDWSDTENIISVFASGNGDYEYSIDGINYQDSNVFSGLDSGKYIIQVRDKNGCGVIKSDEIYLLMFPKFFTPNGDTYNDTWKIKLSDFEEGLSINIYDRYGKLIKTLANNTSEWDGTHNGIALPASDYWFIVTRTNGNEHKGHFSLKR